ncbi:MAG: crossover junction endodeoxyribonuclease RuvC [Bacteroidota bacterium]|nr:crossover junction endodeoxyribonuclease RuvC [Bacteroidota bacterium]MDP4216226.1 crossover junction endodeoxyribonuclease RuvC [Bacteroidota bacterium]MDP4245115.1 crossover junction endodeoxyribonuclease RuvC [Bacteroidota bacterium]MDP4253333.1 crossover junction endodeoxyribonuclease RuvC [Bacteroidota bacterium]MDP4256776.1 crossover junction endodeoxyribonuclease RuvC [Bacteroidota bacterium]
MESTSKIILGIDPGTLIMGFGLVHCSGNHVRMIEMGVLKIPARKDTYERLRLIHKKIEELISSFRPHDFAIEAPFFGKNVQSMLKLGRAQGVAIATAMHAGLSVTEYSPRKVKQSITGNGNSDKIQVWKMLKTILALEELTQEYDASDALAVAVCHHFQRHIPGGTSGGKAMKSPRKAASSWEDFVRKNPGRATGR